MLRLRACSTRALSASLESKIGPHANLATRPLSTASSRYVLARPFSRTSSCHATAGSQPIAQPITTHQPPIPPSVEKPRKHPDLCPGCGAFSQTVDPSAAGFYGRHERVKSSVKSFARQEEDKVFQSAVQAGNVIGFHESSSVGAADTEDAQSDPICDRCHLLLHQSRGNSIVHPSMHSIRQIIEETPHKHNHIYHIVDAADFPMSLIPNLSQALHLPRMRAQNRRSKTVRYEHGRVAEVSFIITRSDLLAPKKEQVDRMLPYLREVLRDALGKNGQNIRLGNVRCLSAHRGWWTSSLKEDIRQRGGAGWMVGKVNVGKSALFEVVFPKGEDHRKPLGTENLQIAHDSANADGVSVGRTMPMALSASLSDVSPLQTNQAGDHADRELPAESDQFASSSQHRAISSQEDFGKSNTSVDEQNTSTQSTIDYSPPQFDDIQHTVHIEEPVVGRLNDDSLLPPLRHETAYPQMPIVSSLPGTTASPIRIPFGNGKGELVDLPGVDRSQLPGHVQPNFQPSLLMKRRIVPAQYSIKPGQSLLLGGLIRLTPKTDDVVFLAYPFVSLQAHVTSTDKAIAIQTGYYPNGDPYAGSISSISTKNARSAMRLAGTYMLDHDVTKIRAGPLTDPVAGKMKAENLPFKIYSTDMLIEGVGWVELVCQVRKRRRSTVSNEASNPFHGSTDMETKNSNGLELFPEIEVWSPQGKFIASRRPMNAWLIGGPINVAKHKKRPRPRQSISMQRRRDGGGKLREAFRASANDA